MSIWFFLLLWFPFSMTYAIVRPRSETSEDKDSWMRLLLVLFVNVQTCTLSCFRKLKKKIYMTFHLTCPLPSAWKDFKSHSLRRKRSLKLFHHMSRCLFFCFRKDFFSSNKSVKSARKPFQKMKITSDTSAYYTCPGWYVIRK